MSASDYLAQVEDTRQQLLNRIAILEGEGYYSEFIEIVHKHNCTQEAAWELLEEERASLNLRPRYTTAQSVANALWRRRNYK